MNEELALRDRHDRERIDTILKQAARIDALEAALQQNVNDWRERGRRIDALEFEVEHERYNVEKTAQEAADRIKALEAALKEAGEMWVRKDNRIEQLEAALRHASSHLADLEYHYHGDREAMWKPIRAALAPEQDK